MKNKNVIKIAKMSSAFLLAISVLLSATHAVSAIPMPQKSIQLGDFVMKINAELHTHHEALATRKPVQDQLADPRHLKRVQAQNAQIADTEPDASCWDAYDSWVGISV